MLQSNYPWVFKSPKEIQNNIEEYKILIIPALTMFDRTSLRQFKNVILKDKYAHIIELMKICNFSLIRVNKNPWVPMQPSSKQKCTL